VNIHSVTCTMIKCWLIALLVGDRLLLRDFVPLTITSVMLLRDFFPYVIL
jgi:hypothetical protein